VSRCRTAGPEAKEAPMKIGRRRSHFTAGVIVHPDLVEVGDHVPLIRYRDHHRRPRWLLHPHRSALLDHRRAQQPVGS